MRRLQLQNDVISGPSGKSVSSPLPTTSSRCASPAIPPNGCTASPAGSQASSQGPGGTHCLGPQTAHRGGTQEGLRCSQTVNTTPHCTVPLDSDTQTCCLLSRLGRIAKGEAVGRASGGASGDHEEDAMAQAQAASAKATALTRRARKRAMLSAEARQRARTQHRRAVAGRLWFAHTHSHIDAPLRSAQPFSSSCLSSRHTHRSGCQSSRHASTSTEHTWARG